MSDDGEPSVAVKKALFALSGNRCAFPQCGRTMVNTEGKVLGEICHIKGRKQGSPRHDPLQSEYERRGFYNLVVLCGYHHTETDDQSVYTVAVLEEMKRKHEVAMSGREIDPASIIIESAKAVVLSQNQSGGITAETINVTMPGRQAEVAEPSLDALQLLHALVNILPQADPPSWKGVLHVFRGMNGVTFTPGADQIKFDDREHTARMESSIDELLYGGLLAQKGEDYFEVTRAGYVQAKSLKWTRDQYWWQKSRVPVGGIREIK